jgi:hypothetical protein
VLRRFIITDLASRFQDLVNPFLGEVIGAKVVQL